MTQDLRLFAETLIFAHGGRADWEAARHAELCEKAGDRRAAELWRKVERALREADTKLAA
jgi:hypothetical protein